MMKFSFIAPSRPDVVIFYSPNKGCLLARNAAIKSLERKCGKWMLDTWYCLTGSMAKFGLTVCDLDAPQDFINDSQWMSHQPVKQSGEMVTLAVKNAQLLGWSDLIGANPVSLQQLSRFSESDRFDRAIACSVALGNPTGALLLAEEAKRLNFLERIRRIDIRPPRVPQDEWLQYKRLRREAITLQEHLASDTISGPGQKQSLRSRLAHLQTQIRQCQVRFRTADSGYLPTGSRLVFDDIRDLVDSMNAVLVEFRVTEKGTLCFLLGPGELAITEQQLVTLPNFTTHVLNEMLVQKARTA